MPDLRWLILNKHYGLAGIFERAELIGANISLESKPGTGVKVRLSWDQSSTLDINNVEERMIAPKESLVHPHQPVLGQDAPQVAG